MPTVSGGISRAGSVRLTAPPLNPRLGWVGQATCKPFVDASEDKATLKKMNPVRVWDKPFAASVVPGGNPG